MTSSRIDDYKRGVILGAGTVGTIYLGTHRESGDRVAIKILHPGVSGDKLIRARFRREMTVLERLSHPNIIAFYGGGEDGDGLLYYIMELVEGGTVKDLMEANGALIWTVVVEIARQICSALQCAHNHGVIHRDLKPGNLFLTPTADVKLGDFGIARDLTKSDLTGEGFTVGTHGYMAPEQITGELSLSGKADLYSLGCCMFEMLTARKPFIGGNSAQLFEQHLRSPPPHAREFCGDCPEELDAIIDQLLAKDPDDRPFNARQVQAVMLQLGERLGMFDEEEIETDGDVPTERALDIGHRILEKQIRGRLGETSAKDVSWVKLFILAALIVGMILAASMLGR